jgi:hypothetical protein
MSTGRNRVVVDVSSPGVEQPRLVEEPAHVSERSELAAVVDEFGCSRTLQVGVGDASAVLALASAHERRGGGLHTVIAAPGRDGGDGIEALRQTGLPDRVEVVTAQPELALPELLRDGVEIDFALIHGGAPFEQVFVESVYLDRLLVTGGVMALAGADGAAMRAVLEFIAEARAYELRSRPGAELAILRKLGQQRVDHVPGAQIGHSRPDGRNGAGAAVDPLARPGSSASRALFLARARADELEERVAELGRALLDAEQRAGEVIQARAEVNVILDQLSVSQATHRRLEHALTSITSSPSWRITAPLRAGKRFLGR